MRQPKTLRRIGRAAFLLLAAVLLPHLPVAAEEPAKAEGAVEVHLKEYTVGIPPTLPAGPTTFVVHNEGYKIHSFKIEGPGTDQLLSAPIKPGETGRLEVTLQPGDYKVYCPVGSHSAKGMTTTLKVTPKPEAGREP